MPSPNNIGDLVTFSVEVNGSPVPDYVQVKSMYVERGINRIPTAKVTVLDGEASTQTFKASSSDTFIPGAKIVINAGYDTQSQAIFKGIITGQSIRIDDSGSVLEVECRDEAIKMIVGRKCLTFLQQRDSDVISSIIGKYSLQSDITTTSTIWPEQIQYNVTDWDFILERAEVNGLIVNVVNGKVSVVKPDADTKPALKVTYGDNMIGFNASLNAITQLGSVKATAWDFKKQQTISGQASVSYPGPGNLSSKTLSGVIGLSDYQIQSTVPFEPVDLNTWSQSQLVKSNYSKIRGEVTFIGTSQIDTGKYLTLGGVGDRFNGDHLVSGVVHTIAEGEWITQVTVGLSPVWFVEELDVLAPRAYGLLTAARGLFNGTVKQMCHDPDSQYRILVNVPLFDPNGAGIWARLSNFYSTSGAGAFFLPEVGDEVVVGFLNEDPRYPIILGSLYSSSTVKPYTGLDPDQANSIKAIVSKSGIVIQFDDENKVLTVLTPDKNQVILNDRDKQITIQDENQNSIVMSSSGITMKSPKKIVIQADQGVSISGTQGITIEAPAGDVAISGINIKETADVQYSAQGGETAQIDSGMELTLKSAMIMIN